ncbi:MAG: acyltransferase family protein [Sphingobium sp.]
MTGESKVKRGDSGGDASARLEWVDAAKGLGIILVVIAHVWTRGFVRDFIYSFHMPLFFLLSGYMSKPRPMGDFLFKQLRAMAVPYVAFLLSLALFDVGFETLRGHHPIFRDAGDAVWRLSMGGSELRGPFTIFWFVPCLFFARLGRNAIAQGLPDARDWRWAVVTAALVAFGVWIGQRTDFSPLGLLSVPVVIALLWLGALWRSLPRDGVLLMIAGVVGLIAVCALPYWHVPPLNIKIGDYGWPSVSLIAAVALSLCVCAAARAVPLKCLCRLGQMSLVIMYLHVAVIHYLTPYLVKYMILFAALLIPIVTQILLKKFAFTRRYYLGEVPQPER